MQSGVKDHPFRSTYALFGIIITGLFLLNAINCLLHAAGRLSIVCLIGRAHLIEALRYLPRHGSLYNYPYRVVAASTHIKSLKPTIQKQENFS